MVEAVDCFFAVYDSGCIKSVEYIPSIDVRRERLKHPLITYVLGVFAFGKQ
jgi:hypothetical protein